MATGLIANKLKMPRTSTIADVVGIVVCLAATTYFVYTYLPVDVDWVRDGPPSVGMDWKGAFREACLALLRGESPYERISFHNPPWVLIPLLPVALLTPALGSAVMYALNLVAFLIVMVKLRTNLLLIPLLLTFSGMLVNSNNGNIEGLLALGFVMPPQIGLFFVLAKPQIGVAVALYWLAESWRAGGLRKVLSVAAPVLVAYLISFLIFGIWIGESFQVVDAWWNMSIWPRGIPVGAFLLGMAIWRGEIKFAIAASPLLAPYLTGHSWAFVLLGLLSLFPPLSFQLGRRRLANAIP